MSLKSTQITKIYFCFLVMFVLITVSFFILLGLTLWFPKINFFPPQIDFEVYWSAGKNFLLHHQIYNKNAATPLTHSKLEFTYPPTAVIFLCPLALLPIKISSLIWSGLTYLFLLGTIMVLIEYMPLSFLINNNDKFPVKIVKKYKINSILLVFFLSLGIGPVRETINYGQINLFLMFIICVDFFVPNRKFKGILIGVAAAIKLTPLALIMYFIFSKQYKTLFNILATFTLTTVLGWILLPQTTLYYWKNILETNHIGVLENPSNQSLNGFINRLLHQEDKIWWILVSISLLIIVVYLMFKLIKLSYYATAFFLNTLLMLYISPISWSHHWVWIIPILLQLADFSICNFRIHKNIFNYNSILLTIGVVVFYIMPQFVIEARGAYEHNWNWYQIILGNAFIIWGLVYLIGWFKFIFALNKFN